MLTKKPIKNIMIKIIPRTLISFIWVIFLIPFLHYIKPADQVNNPKLNVIIDADYSNPKIIALENFLENQNIRKTHLTDKDRRLFLSNWLVDIVIYQEGQSIKIQASSSVDSIFMRNKLNKFLNYLTYYNNENKARDMMNKSPNIIFNNKEIIDSSNYIASYLLFQLSHIVFGLIAIYMNFKSDNKLKRIQVSGVSLKRINFEILIQELIFILLGILIVLAIYGFMVKANTLNLIKTFITYFAFSICILTLVNLISSFFKNERQAYGIVPIITLLFGFSSGLFIPRFLLPSFIQIIGKFSPYYYAINANLETGFTKTYFINLAIILAMGLLYFVLSTKKKVQSI